MFALNVFKFIIISMTVFEQRNIYYTVQYVFWRQLSTFISDDQSPIEAM
jgi:hypothetical protein